MKTDKLLLRCRSIITPDGPVNGYLAVEDGKITCISTDRYSDARDCGDMTMIPGIFDTHNHASCGYSPDGKTKKETSERTAKYLKALASFGVTSVFPTLFATEPDEDSYNSLTVLKDFVGRPQDGAKPLGVNFEGPFLNRTGEHEKRYEAKPINLDYVKKCFAISKGMIKVMGLAPELNGSRQLISYLKRNGAIAAMAHTDANAKEAFQSFEDGITVSTHTCNVMVGIHHRDVGGLGAALLDDRVNCELICDGVHVCNDMLKLIMRTKPQDKVMMISDSSRFVGMPQGTYIVRGETRIIDQDGRVLDLDGGLNGSSRPVLFGIGNLVRNVGIPLTAAVRMASLNPCRVYGFAEDKGSLEVGKDADFVLIDQNFNAQETWSEGRQVYLRGIDEHLENPDLVKCKQK
ncbi:MAG: N-acetylglucosamine-6-phosphate deacetylase [Erysipelotrichaceae bacterium]|nr:N-acetylglucosamine-6-phosphate deacetylase [Erysipelotrichaceae bacterium]